jgi:hypothetical protein
MTSSRNCRGSANSPPGRARGTLAAAALLGAGLAACAPTVRVQAPDEPIEINLNVRIEQEVRVRVERDLEELFEENPELF